MSNLSPRASAFPPPSGPCRTSGCLSMRQLDVGGSSVCVYMGLLCLFDTHCVRNWVEGSKEVGRFGIFKVEATDSSCMVNCLDEK